MIYVFICNLILSFAFLYLSYEITSSNKSNSLKYDKVSNKHSLSISFLLIGLVMFVLSIIFLNSNNLLLLCTGNIILLFSLIFLTIKYK